MIDSHCHLTDQKFAGDIPAILERARNAGVEQIITIADSLEESGQAIVLAEKYAQIFCAVGIHPHHAKQWKDGDEIRLEKIAHSSPKVRAIGEIGLDYHYDFSPRDIQQKVFAIQLQLAVEWQLPVVIHCRNAITDIRHTIEGMDMKKIVLHCCTETWEDVESLVAQGVSLSFTGIATYSQSEEIRHVIHKCPINQMMIETDAPYLPPEALRAKRGRAVRNEPAFVIDVAQLIAKIKRVDLAEVDRTTTANAMAFFGLSP
ncbi:MAG: TatD family hydrolase [Candidatus Peribacteraceae bacterium]|nr:TatD family hydrolase [Candidatus Peribacteraceae bacterium]